MARYSMSAAGCRHVNLGAFICPRRAALAWDCEARRRGRPSSDLNFPAERPTAEEVCAARVALLALPGDVPMRGRGGLSLRVLC